MGFITGQTIINSDWQIDQKSTMTAAQKWNDISTYKEDDFTKIIEPTQKIISYFGDKIGYILPLPTIWSIQNNQLLNRFINSNLINTRSLQEVIDHFSNPNFKFYLSKVEHSGCFKTYFIQFDNISNLREQKLKSIGI